MYSLDFETMMHVIQEHQKTGLLSADLPSGTTTLRESCRVEIRFLAGTVVSWTIAGNSSGRHLSGKNAAYELSRMGRLNWNFTPQQQTIVQPTSPLPAQISLLPVQVPPSPITTPVEMPILPRRAGQVEQRQMYSWSRIHRAVFALADGTKDSVKIAEMLSTSPNLVNKALRDLQSIGAIVMGPQKRRSTPDGPSPPGPRRGLPE